MVTQLSELILDMRYRGEPDHLRAKHPFTPDITATNAVLFSSSYSKRQKIRAYRSWLESYQPCVFGRIAARTKAVFVCLIEEADVLQMKRGDLDLFETIQEHRQAWKRHALDGLSSSFVLLLLTPSLINRQPDEKLKEICRRLMQLYMGLNAVADDSIEAQREYVFWRTGEQGQEQILKFSTLPNVFCVQGDGRWWQDHRTPGGIMITSNALGHFVSVRNKTSELKAKEKLWALENAMRTINNASTELSRSKHCPATHLVLREANETSPLNASSEFARFSADHYKGYFHTDHLIPSAFFQAEPRSGRLPYYEDLSLRYIWDPAIDPSEHQELMTGEVVKWYEVQSDLAKLPAWANPERQVGYPLQTRAQMASWLEDRLKERRSLSPS